MRKTTLILTPLMVLALSLEAQTPPTTPSQPTAALAQQKQQRMAELQKESELLRAQTQLLIDKLQGLQEFQDYVANINQLNQKQAEWNALNAPPPATPTPTPKPAAEKK